MRIAVATGAGMIFRGAMHAADKRRRLIGVAGLALNLSDVVRMRIALDVGVARVAAQTAVNAGAELIAIDGDTVPGSILHSLVAMAGEAVGLSNETARHKGQRKRDKGKNFC